MRKNGKGETRKYSGGLSTLWNIYVAVGSHPGKTDIHQWPLFSNFYGNELGASTIGYNDFE